jgi:hypothetical protein
MSFGNVNISRLDGNIGRIKATTVYPEFTCGLLFDISSQTGLSVPEALNNTVVELDSASEAVSLGITAYESSSNRGFMNGIPYYHISKFFSVIGSSSTARLYVMFADCSDKDAWEDAIAQMSRVSNGVISNIGVWTEQCLWKKVSESANYSLQLVDYIQNAMDVLLDEYDAPTVCVLNANTAKVKTTTGTDNTVVLSKIPTLTNAKAPSVGVFISQEQDDAGEVADMQASLSSTTPVGNVGVVLGEIAITAVGNCIGWVKQCNLADYVDDIEFGFGDSTVAEGVITNPTSYDSLRKRELDSLVEKGYNFYCKKNGLDGVYFSFDYTCSDGDFCNIARNRAANKARRNVRLNLLPYVNSPIKVDPSKGTLSTSVISNFTLAITDALNAMADADELSGVGTVNVPANQNVLQTDIIEASYSIIPMGASNEIVVTEALALSK